MQIVGTDFRSAAVQSRTEWIYFRGILGGPDSIQFDGGSGVWENYKKNWRTMIPEGRGGSWIVDAHAKPVRSPFWSIFA